MTARSWLRNAVDVALNGAIDGTDTSIVVDDATLLPDNTPFYIVIDPFNDTGREYIKVGTITKGTNTLSDLTRNLEGTQSLVHADAAIVRLSWQSQHLDDAWAEPTGINSKAGWKGLWVDQAYLKYDMVRDGEWTTIANKDTTDRPAPEPVGLPSWQSGLDDSPAWSNPTVTASRVISGQRYEPNTPGFISAYRVWIPVIDSDIEYTLVVVNDPEGDGIIDFYRLTPEVTGWYDIPIASALVPSGTVWDLLLVTQHKGGDATFSGPWDYITPQNERAPLAGEIIHAKKAIDVVHISKTDDNAVDRSTDLASLAAGSTVKVSPDGITYELLNDPIDETTYISCLVIPEVRTGTDGVYTFDFTTFGTASITYATIADLYLSNAEIDGFFSTTDLVGGVLNDDGYSPDVYWQPAEFSDDWDVVANAGGFGGEDIDQLYLRLDASNDPITGSLEIDAPLTVIDNDLVIQDASLNMTLAVNPNANIQVAGQNRISFQQSNERIRFLGQTGTVLGHLYDDGTNDLKGSMLGAWVFQASAVALSSGGNTTLWTGLLTVGTLFPGGASQVPELLVVASGYMRQNNQPFPAMQARAEIATAVRSYGYAVGATNAASARSSVPLNNSARIAAGAASVAVQITGRSFATPGVADIEVYFHVYAAPLGGNV